MGTAISIDLRDPEVSPSALDDLFARLREVDERFSTYKAESEVSRLARGDIAESDCSPDVRYILALCDDLARTSDGYFDARHHRADGLLDPSGVVKGWSIEEATWILDEAGAANYMINAGGDIVTRGEPEPGHPWRIGIRHPQLGDKLAAVLEVRDRAIATSGTYERGDHIFDPHTGRTPTAMLSVTVVGPSLTYADAYATAAYAMGLPGLTWVAEHPGYDAYGITADERVLWTPGFDRYLIAGEAAAEA